MTLLGWLQIALTLALVVVCAVQLSKLIAAAYAGERNFLTPILGPVERAFYRLAGVDPAREQGWFAYTVAMVVFSVAGCRPTSRRRAPSESGCRPTPPSRRPQCRQ